MPIFSNTIPQVATAAAANAFTTLVGIKFADTLGHRARLRKLIIAGGGGAPQDEQVAIKITKSDLSADGTSTAVNVNLIGKQDPLSVASNVAAIGKTFTVEPTAKGTTIHAAGGLNARGVLVRDWTNDPAGAPAWGQGETLCIEGAPGQAAAVNLTVAVEWEEY